MCVENWAVLPLSNASTVNTDYDPGSVVSTAQSKNWGLHPCPILSETDRGTGAGRVPNLAAEPGPGRQRSLGLPVGVRRYTVTLGVVAAGTRCTARTVRWSSTTSTRPTKASIAVSDSVATCAPTMSRHRAHSKSSPPDFTSPVSIVPLPAPIGATGPARRVPYNLDDNMVSSDFCNWLSFYRWHYGEPTCRQFDVTIVLFTS